MPKKKFIILIVFWIVVAALAWTGASAFVPEKTAFNYNVNGLIVQSNDSDPQGYFAELGNSKAFIVSPAMHEPVSGIDQHVFAAATTFSVVLNGNDKDVTMLIRVFDETENLVYCLTNMGDVRVSEQITNTDCLEELASEEKVRILVNSPNMRFVNPVAFLEKNSISLDTQSHEQLRNASFIVSRIMFENAEEIITQSNEIIERLLSTG